DVDEGLEKGKLGFTLHGKRLTGNWALVRLRNSNKKNHGRDNWLLIKEKDAAAKSGGASVVERETASVKSGREMEEIARGNKVWHSDRAKQDMAKSKGLKKKAARLPAFVSPQLATLAEHPPEGNDWLHEIKYDGYRAVVSVAGDEVVIRTRKGL